MEPWIRLLHVVVPVLWTAASAAYVFAFVRDDTSAGHWGFRLAVLAVLAHATQIAATFGHGTPPLVVPGALISGMGLATALVYLGLERRIGRATIGVFAVGTAALLVTAGAALADPLAPPREGIPPKTSFHVGGAILGYAGLLLGALFGALTLAQQHALRRRRFGLFWERLPSVELLDAFTVGSLLAATVFLTVTIGLGHATRHAAERAGPYWDAKVIATNALWLLTLVTCVARRSRRLRVSTAAAASIALFLVAVANMTVVDRFSNVHRGL